MSDIALGTWSADLQLRVERATDGNCLSLPLGPLPASPASFFAALEVIRHPEVVVLDSGHDPQAALDLALLFDQQCPGISVIVVSELGQQIGLPAMRAGVRDILHPDATSDDIRFVIDQARDVAHARAMEPEVVDGAPLAGIAGTGRVIAVVSPKGGVGKTTVATNLAVGLAMTERHSTILVDLDVQFGDVGSALNLDPEYSLADAVHGPASRDTMVLKTFLSLHETGLYVICGPKSPAVADSITGPEVGHLLQMLASEFHYVVVDTAPGLSEHVLAAMDEASDLVLVTSMDVPGVRGLRKELDALTDLGMLTDARHVVLNFTDSHGGLSVADVELTIGTPIHVKLPRSKAALGSVNSGVPLLQGGGRDPMTKALRQLVARFTPASVNAAKLTHVTRRSRLAAKEKESAANAEGSGAPPRRAAPRFRRLGGATS